METTWSDKHKNFVFNIYLLVDRCKITFLDGDLNHFSLGHVHYLIGWAVVVVALWLVSGGTVIHRCLDLVIDCLCVGFVGCVGNILTVVAVGYLSGNNLGSLNEKKQGVAIFANISETDGHQTLGCPYGLPQVRPPTYLPTYLPKYHGLLLWAVPISHTEKI